MCFRKWKESFLQVAENDFSSSFFLSGGTKIIRVETNEKYNVRKQSAFVIDDRVMTPIKD